MLKRIFKDYFDRNSAVDESIIILTLTFLFNIFIIIYYVFYSKSDIPSGVVNILEYMYPISALNYGIKGAVDFVKIIKGSNRANMG